jgi:hypothetical protein
MFEILN